MIQRINGHAQRGAITVLAAVVLYAIVLLGVVAWGGIQEGADHALISRLLGNAVYDASHRLSDDALVASLPILRCLDSSCAPVACSAALLSDPTGTTAPGAACQSLQRGLVAAYNGNHARLDVPATLAATQVWMLSPGTHDPENAARTYHYPTVCLSTEAAVGVLAHEGLVVRQHFHACAQIVYG